jgi:hypothetical protein
MCGLTRTAGVGIIEVSGVAPDDFVDAEAGQGLPGR